MSSSSSSSSIASASINAEISGASSDPLVASAIANIKAEFKHPPVYQPKDGRRNLFTEGRDHPLFHRHTNNTLDSSQSVADILSSTSCGCFMKDRSGGFSDFEATQLLNYEPEGSASRLFKKTIALKSAYAPGSGVSV
jgi:hypothetical protein